MPRDERRMTFVVVPHGGSGDLSTRSAEDIERLGEQYGVTHVVTTGRLPLPPVFENTQFRVYALPPVIRLASH